MQNLSEQQQPEAASAEPASTVPPLDDGVDALIREFEEKTAQQPELEPATDSGQSSDELTALLHELDGSADRAKIQELSGQVDSYRAAEFQRQEREAAEVWAADLQAHCVRMNPNLDDSFVKDRLLIMAAQDSSIERSWQYRNLTDADLAIAKRDFLAAEKLYDQALKAPDSDPRKQEALRFLEQRGQQLQTMLTARQTIRSVRNAILKKADSVKPPYDPIATEDRELVAQSIREGGSGRAKIPPEPPPNLGAMTSQEYRQYVRTNYGYDPGV